MVLYDSLPRPRRSISAAAALEDKCDNCRRTGSSSAFRLLQRHGWRPLSPVGQPGEFGHLQKSLNLPGDSSAVSGAPLGQTPEWLPAVEQFGEGFFLQFEPEALASWLSQPGLLERAGQLQAGATAWINQKLAHGQKVSGNSFREHARPEYILAHSLAHALMGEVALDCGYPASALKERLYVPPRVPGQPTQCGVLIYPPLPAIRERWVVSSR